MKKLILSLVAMMMSMSLLALSTGPSTIPIKPNPNPNKPNQPNGSTTPLSLVRTDIEATCSMGAITFVFNEDLGNCDIEVANIDTGEVWYASCVGISSTIVYTSGSEGQYYIYIDTDSGAYTGEYNNY